MAPVPQPWPSSSPASSSPPSSLAHITASLAHLSHRALHALGTELISLAKRQQIVAIPTTYATENNSPSPGTVAGIVLGTVAGVLLVLWLLYTCFNIGGGPTRSAVVDEVDVRRRRSRSRSPRRRSVSRSEVIEVRNSPRRERSNRRETIVIEETRRAPPPQDDDIVEVIEEDDTPPPSRRQSDRRRVSSGYRNVDPEEFGGGNRPMRKVRR